MTKIAVLSPICRLVLLRCTADVTGDKADAMSSAAAAKAMQCDAPLLEARSIADSGAYFYVWKCGKQDDGSQRRLEVTVSTSGEVDLKAMMTFPDDPVFDLTPKKK